MTRVQLERGVIPQICKAANELEIWTTRAPESAFEIQFEFPEMYTPYLESSDGDVIPLSSNVKTNYNFRSVGLKRLVLKGLPLKEISLISAPSQNIVAIGDLGRTRSTYIDLNTNLAIIQLESIPYTCTTFYAAGNYISGCARSLPIGIASLNISGGNSSMSGTLDEIPATISNYLIPAAGLAVGTGMGHLINGRKFYFNNQGWSQADIDILYDSIYQNRAAFTYATPYIKTNGCALPTGTYKDPSVNPGDGNTDCDWAWVTDHHEPLSGMAQVYYLENGPNYGIDVFNRWEILLE